MDTHVCKLSRRFFMASSVKLRSEGMGAKGMLFMDSIFFHEQADFWSATTYGGYVPMA